MKSYSNNATSYYLWNENIEARDDFTFTDKDFIAMLKTYDEVVILDKKISSDNKKWCHIGYKGKSEVLAWIPCSSIQHIN